jgi:hypothetical protein
MSLHDNIWNFQNLRLHFVAQLISIRDLVIIISLVFLVTTPVPLESLDLFELEISSCQESLD